MEVKTFQVPPDDFQATGEGAGCFISCDETLLFLKRHESRPHGNTWGLPGGKLEPGESAKAACLREVLEEVGLEISQGIVEVGKMYIQYPETSFIWHMFSYRYDAYPAIDLRLDEHVEARWVTFDEALCLPLIVAGRECLEYYLSVESRL